MDQPEIFLELAHKKLEEQHRMAASYDTKTAILLAVYGVVLAGMPGVAGEVMSYGASSWALWLGAGIWFIGVLASLAVLGTRRSPGLPGLEDTMNAQVDSPTKDEVIAAIYEQAMESEFDCSRIVSFKHRAFRLSCILLIATAIVNVYLVIKG